MRECLDKVDRNEERTLLTNPMSILGKRLRKQTINCADQESSEGSMEPTDESSLSNSISDACTIDKFGGEIQS